MFENPAVTSVFSRQSHSQRRPLINFLHKQKGHRKKEEILDTLLDKIVQVEKKNRIGVQSLMVMPSKLWRFEWSERGI